MAEIRINATGGVKLYDADDSHYAQIIAGTITSNTDVMTLGHNVIDIPMTTASSSATTGALTIGGGLGVAADLYVGDDTYLITDSAVLGFGADKDTTLTHTDGTGLTLNSTNKLCFNDATQFVQGISGTVLGLGATDEIDLTATAVDLNGTLDVSGASQFNGDMVLAGTTPTLTIGDAGAEDTMIVFDGNAVDYRLGIDDSADAFEIGIGSTHATTSQMYFSSSGIVVNQQSNDYDFTIEGNGDDDLFFVNGGTDRIGINAGATPEAKLHVIAAGGSEPAGYFECNSANSQMIILNNSRADDGSETSLRFDRADTVQGAIGTNAEGISFWTNSTLAEKMRIDSAGDFFVNTTDATLRDDSSDGYGMHYDVDAALTVSSNGHSGLDINRQNNDGAVTRFYQEGSEEGSISVSGTTISYNAFCGSHWSRLADNSKPTILRGTVIESISEMMDWYVVEYNMPVYNMPVVNQENVIEQRLKKGPYALKAGDNVGDTVTYTKDGVDYTGTIVKEDNERLPKCKISTTDESKAVYGVFMAWDDDDDGSVGVNDMYVASLGAFIVRVHSGETVAIGDYLQSRGDGTAKVQADDILRASTIGKVTSTEKTHIHADGSYCVPCTLHCG